MFAATVKQMKWTMKDQRLLLLVNAAENLENMAGSLWLSLCLVAVALAHPNDYHSLGKASMDHKMVLRMALKQRNVDALEKAFWDISDPKSPRYGAFLSLKGVGELVRPTDEHLAAVSTWAESVSCLRSHHIQPVSQDYLYLQLDVACATTTFGADMHLFVANATLRPGQRPRRPLLALRCP